MGKRPSLISLLVGCSLLVNLFFILPIRELNWTRRAAEDAEAVAAITCAGKGRAYVDGVTKNGKPVCECFACFTGPDCSQPVPFCTASADSGDPYLNEQYWMRNAAGSTIVLSGWHRLGGSIQSVHLEQNIRKLHAFVGNADTKGRHIVFGVGSTQLQSAAIYALSQPNSSSPARVVTSVPYDGVFKQQTVYYQSGRFEFEGDASLWKNMTSDDSTNLIELVTSPNNADGQLKKAVLEGPNVKAIHSRIYYWPQFTPISAPADEDIMLFSLSTLTGDAGSRFGWAVVKDEKVFQKMYNHVKLNTLGVSMDSEARALQLIKVALENVWTRNSLFEFGYQKLSKRWERVNWVLSDSPRFSLQKIKVQYCSFFKKVRGASPGFAWIKCERQQDKDCYEVFRAANIIGRRGSDFGAEERFIRLSLLNRDGDFDLLLYRLNELVLSKEYEAET